VPVAKSFQSFQIVN